MNNFFYSSSDYDLFKKALRTTKNEPVIINILSDDSSLNEGGDAGTVVNAQRKQMSSKFQASPFDKFFGPRKKRTDPLDMKDFSSWKNKNYRESEKQIDSAPETTTKFSFSDYLNSRTKDKKYNNEDELKSESQKSIEQMNSSDNDFKKFSLDSYLNKLEQQTKAKKDFDETDDLVSSFVDENAMSMQNTDIDQDENFMNRSSIGVEDIAFGNEIKGEKFSFDREELETVKARLDKLERESNNIKDKPTTKLISSNDIRDITKDDNDEFNFDKLGIEDDIERVNSKIDSLNKVLQPSGDDKTDDPKIEGNKFFEINKQFEENDSKKEDYSKISTSESLAQRISESAPINVSGMSDGSTLVINTNGTGPMGGTEEFISTAPMGGTSFVEPMQTASSGVSHEPMQTGSSGSQVSISQGTAPSSSSSSTSSTSSTTTSSSTTSSSSSSGETSTQSTAVSESSGSGQAKTTSTIGVVKPVVIVGSKANPEELKDSDKSEEDSTDGSESIIDAVEMISDDDNAIPADGVSVVSGIDGIDGYESLDGVDIEGLDFGLDGETASQIKSSDEYITKADLRTITDEIIGKFSELNRNSQTSHASSSTTDYENPYGMSYKPEDIYGSQASMVGQTAFAGQGVSDNPLLDQNRNVFGIVSTTNNNGNNSEIDREYKKKQDELQAQLMELIEQNKRTDEEITKKLELAEQEKLRVAEEYEKRLRELEESMLKREEAVKQQAYIDKLKNDIKFKKSENKYKLREEQIRESEKSNTQSLLDCEKLKSELRNCLSVSNLEMDKKLLECVNKLHKAEIEKQEQKVEELEQDLKEEKEIEKPARPKTTTSKRRPSTVKSRMRTRTPRRRIDSDIIGGINFD